MCSMLVMRRTSSLTYERIVLTGRTGMQAQSRFNHAGVIAYFPDFEA